jgi:hypothetical protein
MEKWYRTGVEYVFLAVDSCVFMPIEFRANIGCTWADCCITASPDVFVVRFLDFVEEKLQGPHIEVYMV